MKIRKTKEGMNRRLQEAERRSRAPRINSLIAEALRLCRGVADLASLLSLCPAVDIQGAIELGLLVERKGGGGQRTFIAGPKLDQRDCDLAKAISIEALVEQSAKRG